jgi:hypothetical protein
MRHTVSHKAALKFRTGDRVRHEYRGKLEGTVCEIGARDLRVRLDGVDFLITWFAELCYHAPKRCRPRPIPRGVK